MPALVASVTQLQKQGVNCELVKGGAARMWAGRPKQGEYVLRLPDCQFDVCLERQEANGPLVPVCDLHAGAIARVIGWPDYTPTRTNDDGTVKTPGDIADEMRMAAIGRFAQQYSNFATINALQEAGHTIIEQNIDAEGRLQLRYT